MEIYGNMIDDDKRREKARNITKISWELFKEKNDKEGFFIFAADSCDLCYTYLFSIKDKMILDNLIVVEITLESDQEEARNILPNFVAVPFTTLYFKNEQVSYRRGQLFEDDLDDLKIEYNNFKKRRYDDN